MNDQLIFELKLKFQLAHRQTNATPVCGWWIPPCLTVHHHFLFIRIQRKNNIIWLLDKNRPKLFTFYNKRRDGEKMIIIIITECQGAFYELWNLICAWNSRKFAIFHNIKTTCLILCVSLLFCSQGKDMTSLGCTVGFGDFRLQDGALWTGLALVHFWWSPRLGSRELGG